MSKEPFYIIDQDTERTIIEVKQKAIDLSLDNIRFSYHMFTVGQMDFHLIRDKPYWALVVKQKKYNSGVWEQLTDRYIIDDDNYISYKHSKSDIL